MASIYPSSSSTSSSTSSASLLRISGMASGIDTDAVVKSMVSSYQSKIDKANQDKQTLQWKQDEYRDIIKDIKGLQDYFDPISSKYMMSGNSFNTNSAANGDSSIVSGTASSSAKVGTYRVKVTQLAEQAKIEGSSLNSMVKVTTPLIASNWEGQTLMFNGNEPIKISSLIADTNGDSKISTDELVADINKQIAGSTSLNGKISASYVNDGTNDYIKFTKSASETNIQLNATGTTISGITDLTINSGITSSSKLSDLGVSGDISFSLSYDTATNAKPVSITANSSSTIKELIDKVNSATGGAVTMSLDDITGKLTLDSKNFGSASSLQITAANNIDNLGFTNNTSVGKDAVVAITAPGQQTVTTTQSSNKFTSNGITYNMVATGDSTVTVTSNTDTVVGNIKKFIDDYNSVISTINTKLTEKKNKDYAPLTDDQKESMSEDQIKTWETKAKVGILKNDSYLQSLMSQLRGTLYSPVYNSYDSANSKEGMIPLSFGSYGTGAIGIETSTDYTDGGKLVLKDEAKLKSAIENNLEDFKKLFIGASDSTLGTTESYIGSQKYNEDGIFKRMDTIMRDYVASPGLGEDGTYSLSGYMNIFVNKQYDYSSSGSSSKNTLPDQVYNKTISISKFQTQLSDASTRYYAKFTALETAMNTLNSQQSALSSMLGTSS